MKQEATIKVLLVDDEDRFRTTTATTLSRRGFQVATAAGGLDAIWEMERGAFDVIVLDIKMPGMDGHRVLRQIKKHRPEVAVIVLTGHVSMDSAFEALRDDAFSYLSKPCDIELLANRIRDAHTRKRTLTE